MVQCSDIEDWWITHSITSTAILCFDIYFLRNPQGARGCPPQAATAGYGLASNLAQVSIRNQSTSDKHLKKKEQLISQNQLTSMSYFENL